MIGACIGACIGGGAVGSFSIGVAGVIIFVLIIFFFAAASTRRGVQRIGAFTGTSLHRDEMCGIIRI